MLRNIAAVVLSLNFPIGTAQTLSHTLFHPAAHIYPTQPSHHVDSRENLNGELQSMLYIIQTEAKTSLALLLFA